MFSKLRSVLRARRGQGVVEIALVLPVLAMLFSGIIDYGRTFSIQNALHRVAKEGVNYGTQLTATGGKPTANEIRARMQQSAIGWIDGNALIFNSIQVGSPNAAGLESVSVDVSYDVQMLTPLVNNFFTNGRLRLNSRASLPYTQFTKTAVAQPAAVTIASPPIYAFNPTTRQIGVTQNA
jgi:Flp pilus assembly protein TadG